MTKSLGLDPGTKSSPTAIAFIELECQDRMEGLKFNFFILDVVSIPTVSILNLSRQIDWISNSFRLFTTAYKPDIISIERSFYQGAANANHLFLLGNLQSRMTDEELGKVVYIAPLSVRKFFGSGKLEKEQVANSLLKYAKDKKDVNIIKKLIEAKDFDKTDAIAIAIAGGFSCLKSQS